MTLWSQVAMPSIDDWSGTANGLVIRCQHLQRPGSSGRALSLDMEPAAAPPDHINQHRRHGVLMSRLQSIVTPPLRSNINNVQLIIAA